ncbi:hypothetical protein BDD43_0070 [Mucilaginibacter gracilis]|uniref:Uncharacterized protein n=1 Tax=Mucilaginibacter gracilis TaxID=423350 RepID=A0A495ITX4_9SPHI|nr:hypothetical protein [Mucilaginibacter gracilis]RKR79983.1 hypothetical protein BDD43_0070 [Mucilaginibacter gracilis]
MLHTISWPQFLITASVLAGLWCLAVAVLYYRGELENLFKGKPKEDERAWQEEMENEPDGLMGQAREPEGMETVGMQDLHFGPENKDEALGLVPDVLEELKYIFYQLEQTGGGKDGFLELFSAVADKYAQVSNKAAINDYIRENVAFDISDAELEVLCA